LLAVLPLGFEPGLRGHVAAEVLTLAFQPANVIGSRIGWEMTVRVVSVKQGP
jgi:hypothetical protein